MDEILKNYSQPKTIDDAIVAIDILHHGFAPYYWIPRGRDAEAQERYRNIVHKFLGNQITEEMMKGEAFGL